jgi:Cysteine-rich CPCC
LIVHKRFTNESSFFTTSLGVSVHDLPCPCCGFLTLEQEYGSYSICPVCGWEDDPVQLANPSSGGGANKQSLAEAQAVALVKYPANVEIASGFRRAAAWRPLAPSELQIAEERRAVKHWGAQAILQESEAYWS